MTIEQQVLWLDKLTLADIEQVGGKNASLGEMITHLSTAGVQVPNGFATTAYAYLQFLEQNNLVTRINEALSGLDINDVQALAKIGASIRQWVLDAPLLPELELAVRESWRELSGDIAGFAVAVRSSATAEDLPDASFAGQQETYLNVSGIENVLQSIKRVYASLFTDRAIAYREHHGYPHNQVALSVGIQKMVRSDLGKSGVMFTLDTETGFNDVVFITASYGLGEMIVQGAVNPDEFYVHKPTLQKNKFSILRKTLGGKHQKMVYDNDASDFVKTVSVEDIERTLYSLTDEQIQALAKQALLIETHYQRPMDIEWALDGVDGQLYIVQARPETVQSRTNMQVLERYELKEKGACLVQGRSVGQRIGQGKARVIKHLADMNTLEEGDVLVTDMTDPDWEPVMKRATAIVTNRGGRTCHAAIIARELGIPAVVGCGDATALIDDHAPITVSCAEGDTGMIYDGLVPFELHKTDLENMPTIPFKIMLNVGNPDKAFTFQALPNAGVGLARLEFIINKMIGIHPHALLNFDELDEGLRTEITHKIRAYASPVDYYVSRLREGIATLAAAFYPKPVIVRLSDFKSNEYANLLGGQGYEPREENPMLGFRGAARYVDSHFRECFDLECEAIKQVRNEMGLTNVEVMVPFVRTTSEAEAVIKVLAENGLERGKDGLKLIMMCELPSNALMAEAFLEYFDGFSIGSNDLTQLTLGLDRDSSLVADHFDERNPAVKTLLHQAIRACKKAQKYVGICGQGPSDHSDFAHWLMKEGIDSISLNPDSVIETWLLLSKG